MTELDTGFIEAQAKALGIPIRPEWHEGIWANLAISHRLAGIVAEFPLDDEADMAPVFVA